MTSMIERYQVRYFLAVVEAGSFSRAAAHVNVTQPTLSIGIAKLERTLRTKVFLRNSQRVHLTDAGARLLAYAREVERGFQTMEADVNDAQAATVVRIGILNTIPTATIEAVVSANAASAAPNALELVEASERDLLARMERRRIDLALTLLRPGLPKDQEELYREGYALALPIWHPLAGEPIVPPSALAAEVMIVRRHCEVLSETSRHFTQHGIRPRFSLRTVNDDRALAMVAAGLGVTVMPASFRWPGVARPRLGGFDHQRRIGLLYARHILDQTRGMSSVITAIRSACSGLTE